MINNLILYLLCGSIIYVIMVKVVNTFLLDKFDDSEIYDLNSIEIRITIVLLWPAFTVALIYALLVFIFQYIKYLIKNVTE